MEREIFWYTLGGSDDDAAFTASAIRVLVDRLGQVLPELKLRGAELPVGLIEQLLPHLEAGYLDGAVVAIQDYWGTSAPGVLSHVTVYCPDPTHPAVCAARGRLRHAAWGISLAGTLSLTYAPRNPYALWHESFHLLGAQDHYDLETFRTTCDLPTCLMQYAPDEQTVGQQPFVCPATAAILRKACA